MRLKPPIILVHGGAGSWRSLDLIKKVREVLEKAVSEGFKILRNASALEAVVEAVKVMEDSGILNAGLGSVTDILGGIGMDAGIMTSDGRIGAVANVSYPRNPILLAKYVMEYTDHVLIVGEGANELAKRLGLEKHPGPIERVRKRYEELLREALRGKPPSWFKRSYEVARKLWSLGDTVGAVALDSNGMLAAAVSTGGVIMKLPGRVGDSAIPGAGFYASRSAAAVATGIGETIIKSFLTLHAIMLVEDGLNAAEAAKKVIEDHTRIHGKDTAGIIVVDSKGFIGASFNTIAMPWAALSSDGKILLGGHEGLTQ